MSGSETTNILAIESSCDDTSAAVISNGKMLANVMANQAVHQAYGGVVPELASRAHQQNIMPVVQQALRKAGIVKEDLQAIAVTRGPGLLGSLLVGTSFAKGLAMALQIPLIDVHHMKAHVLAHFIDNGSADYNPPEFPFMCLTVSGGHTQIVKVTSPSDMEILGQTLDDAAGEAFDKAAKILGLPYPGGPLIDKHARLGNPMRFEFPEPKIPGLNYSFSGLKTSFLYFLQEQVSKDPQFLEDNMNDICASFENRITTVLLSKLKRAAREHHITHIAIAGGVSANSGLREGIVALGEKMGWQVYIPEFQYCTDNAAMIAQAAQYQYELGDYAELNIAPQPRMEF